MAKSSVAVLENAGQETKECTTQVGLVQDMKQFVRWMAKDGDVLDYFAGDTKRVPRNLQASLEQFRRKKGDELYIDLLQALTHTRFSAGQAKQLWHDILKHKYYISEKLGRNVGVKVAVLDYLDNHTGIVKDFQLLPEKDLDCLLLYVNEDGLTGLYNHRYFQELLREELARCRRYDRVVSLLFADLDHFKSYNDHLGHRQGDVLLKDVAAFLKASCRHADAVARYGGDEFAVILPETNREEAVTFARRMHADFSRQPYSQQLPGLPYPVTMSIGVASYPVHGTQPEELIDAADQALYRAKRAGANGIQLAESVRLQ